MPPMFGDMTPLTRAGEKADVMGISAAMPSLSFS